MRRSGILIGGAAALLVSPATAQETAAAPAMGRQFSAVNGTTIQCPLPAPRDAAALAAQLETRPRDLDELSRGAAAFFSGDNPAGAAFRARRDQQFATDWPFLCRYRDANADLLASGVQPRVVFIGDSITEGWIEADPQFFADRGFVSRGISGQSSPQILARFQHDVVALRPQAVHIMTGTNDIGGATGPITEEEYINTVSAMIDLAQAGGIAVILASIPPMSRLLPGRNSIQGRWSGRSMNDWPYWPAKNMRHSLIISRRSGRRTVHSIQHMPMTASIRRARAIR